jgi:solute carrier family 35, member F1/2
MAHNAPQVAYGSAPEVVDTAHVQPKGVSESGGSGNELVGQMHGVPEFVGTDANGHTVVEQEEKSKGKWFSYVKTKQFWLVLLLGQGTYIHHKIN